MFVDLLVCMSKDYHNGIRVSENLLTLSQSTIP